MRGEFYMIRILTGEKGDGKTKKILEMANEAIKLSHGNIIFIDNDNKNMYGLHYNIRFVETSDFPISNYRELVGFICGIISQDNDIEKIYIDSIDQILKNFDNDDLIKFVKKLSSLSQKYSLEFFLSLSAYVDTIPYELRDLTI